MIKNQDLAKQIYEMMNTAIDASWQMKDFLLENQGNEFAQVAGDLYDLLDSIRQISKQLDEEQAGMNLWASSESVCVSLERIIAMVSSDRARTVHKIEFELVPLLEDMRLRFYYFGMVYPDEEKIKQYYEKEITRLTGNRYVEKSEKTGNYKYELSIRVLGYNKLEYTKQCMTAMKAFLPQNISYELILVNHGSNDGTKEYFESLHPDKQLDIAVNGGGLLAANRIFEGKYLLTISNDVLVLENAIQNMYEGICEDERIAWVVPATTNVSNLQAPERSFESLEDVKAYAHANNVRDAWRWEQKIRLVNPIDIVRGTVYSRLLMGRFQSPDSFSFPDDATALMCRRSGYKMFLAKDSFCFHYGSVTLGEGNTAQKFENGRKEFQKAFGIDPWNAGFCHSYALVHEVKFDKKTPVRILGIDCGLGANPLKIKEILKETMHNTDVYLKNLTTRSNLLADLKGISDEAGYIDDYSEIKETDAYDYVICEEFEPVYESVAGFMERLYGLCKPSGRVMLSVAAPVAQELYRTRNKLKAFFNGLQIIFEAQRCWLVLDRGS